MAAGLTGCCWRSPPVIILLRIFHSPARLVLRGHLPAWPDLRVSVPGHRRPDRPSSSCRRRAGSIGFVYFSYVSLTRSGTATSRRPPVRGGSSRCRSSHRAAVPGVGGCPVVRQHRSDDLRDAPGDLHRAIPRRGDERCGRSSRSCRCELSPPDPGRKTSDACVTPVRGCASEEARTACLRAEALSSSPRASSYPGHSDRETGAISRASRRRTAGRIPPAGGTRVDRPSRRAIAENRRSSSSARDDGHIPTRRRPPAGRSEIVPAGQLERRRVLADAELQGRILSDGFDDGSVRSLGDHDGRRGPGPWPPVARWPGRIR